MMANIRAGAGYMIGALIVLLTWRYLGKLLADAFYYYVYSIVADTGVIL